uniref:Uncharacterized protein MANES_13G083500 n=1 Tax=Rhizophora mucronata TaxID=61149 RepID=A0A2P2PNG7_RHIMU
MRQGPLVTAPGRIGPRFGRPTSCLRWVRFRDQLLNGTSSWIGFNGGDAAWREDPAGIDPTNEV